ncbi:hypothetical protein MKW94_030089 [Papaver nudicaule]|uniref:Dual specificity protein phosphatase 12 n=1 Tax=Papaver nudicaule TaxID=74823 RepID=A0AA42B1B9_PAPNU|nr:hypothetical protein [Papaver nudicaule]
MEATSGSSLEMETKLVPQTIYRCKKCRRMVAAQENCFKWKKRSGETEPPRCSFIFVEPLKWMPDLEGNIEQKLLCVGCNARLGSFNWAGMQCSCGTWSAFQLHKNRIDECPL